MKHILLLGVFIVGVGSAWAQVDISPLTPSPSSLSVPEAATSSPTISVNVVRAAAVGVPPIIVAANLEDATVGTISISGATIAGNSGVATVTVNVSQNCLPGDYKLDISATDTSGTRQTLVNIHVGSSAFSLVFGLGSLITNTAGRDYKVQNDTLVVTSLGKARPEIDAGAAFRLKIPTPNPGSTKYPWSAFVSLRLAPGSDNTVSGFVFGGSYRIAKYLNLLVGYSLSPFDEPTPGFRNAAAQVVEDNPTIAVYQRFVAADMLSNKPNAFDGFPLAVQSAAGPTGQRVFPTDALATHYRGGIFLGVAFPLSLKAKLAQ